ncbi:hypothetical protein C8Q75DRAFT_352091 [Abortiporus biennis]|nr:hypothetical protein C8Q75DRAFT_352091 [Abortiporus biennis]
MASSMESPNPLTPLAWLPPDLAGQLEASRYLYSATVSAWLWDFFMSIPEEYLVFSKGRLNLPDAVYILSRIFTCSFIINSLVFQVSSVADCHTLTKAIGWSAAIALPLNSLLFFFRVRAVFHNDTVITFIFGFLWLSTLACFTAPFAVDGGHIGTTSHCINTSVQPSVSVALIVVGVHDTIVFFAITTRLTMMSLANNWKDRARAFLSGRGMGHISRTVLMSGQIYYLVTVGMNIFSMVAILTPSFPPVLRAMFTVPNIALQNAMACLVYRQVKLGVIREPSRAMTTTISGHVAAPIQLVPIFRSRPSVPSTSNGSRVIIKRTVVTEEF